MMEKVFSLPFKCFDRLPEDSELVCLLGEIDHPGQITVLETSESLLVRPGLIPIKFVVPWMLLTGSLITAMPWIASLFGGNFSGPHAVGVDRNDVARRLPCLGGPASLHKPLLCQEGGLFPG